MHVLISGWFWQQPHTGSGQYLRHLLARMRQQQPAHRYTLLLPAEPAAATRPPDCQILAAPPPPLPRQLAKLYWEQVTVPQTARRLRADVLFVPYWAAPAWQPVPTVVTVHDVVQRVLPAYRGGRLMQLYTRMVSHTARRSAAVLTVSQASKREIVQQLGIPARRVFAVHHGPNSPQRQTPGPQVQQKYRLPARYFLYLGGFDVRKNVEGIIRAYARYRAQGGDPAVALVLAGKLPGQASSFFPDPRQMAAQWGVAEQVHFPGWVEEADKPALYAGATAFLFPSTYEGFGMMLLEAMAAGCPVITSGSPDALGATAE